MNTAETPIPESPAPNSTAVVPAQPAILPASPSKPARRPRWSLATLLLLTAAVAAWTAVWRVHHENRRLRATLDSLLKMARELNVVDPNQFAVVEEIEGWHGEDIWQIHLPAGRRYRVKLATRGVERGGFPAVAKAEAELDAGRHRLELRREAQADMTQRLIVLVNDRVLLEASETADWTMRSGASSFGVHSQSSQHPTDQPLVLQRVQFHTPKPGGGSTSPDGPANGSLLWLESGIPSSNGR